MKASINNTNMQSLCQLLYAIATYAKLDATITMLCEPKSITIVYSSTAIVIHATVDATCENAFTCAVNGKILVQTLQLLDLGQTIVLDFKEDGIHIKHARSDKHRSHYVINYVAPVDYIVPAKCEGVSIVLSQELLQKAISLANVCAANDGARAYLNGVFITNKGVYSTDSVRLSFINHPFAIDMTLFLSSPILDILKETHSDITLTVGAYYYIESHSNINVIGGIGLPNIVELDMEGVIQKCNMYTESTIVSTTALRDSLQLLTLYADPLDRHHGTLTFDQSSIKIEAMSAGKKGFELITTDSSTIQSPITVGVTLSYLKEIVNVLQKDTCTLSISSDKLPLCIKQEDVTVVLSTLSKSN